MSDDVREKLFDDWSEEEFRNRITSTSIRETGTAQTVTATTTKVLEIGVASGEQVRVIGYKWFQADSGPTRARIQAVASAGFASVVDRDYLDTPGRADNQGEGWQNPYLTVDMHQDGSITFLADALSTGAQASINRVSVSVRGMRFSRLDESRL